MRHPERIVAAARDCLGTRFRAHGRRPEHGLDCVGVAAWAFGRDVTAAYPLRGGDPVAISALIAATGLRPVLPAHAIAADLLLIEAGLGQLHLVVLTDKGFIHADARLRRVVETPGRPAGRVLGAWRERED